VWSWFLSPLPLPGRVSPAMGGGGGGGGAGGGAGGGPAGGGGAGGGLGRGRGAGGGCGRLGRPLGGGLGFGLTCHARVGRLGDAGAGSAAGARGTKATASVRPECVGVRGRACDRAPVFLQETGSVRHVGRGWMPASELNGAAGSGKRIAGGVARGLCVATSASPTSASRASRRPATGARRRSLWPRAGVVPLSRGFRTSETRRTIVTIVARTARPVRGQLTSSPARAERRVTENCAQPQPSAGRDPPQARHPGARV
jgi:hypothetical protein